MNWPPNPPPPAGAPIYEKPTPDMTAWAFRILHDPGIKLFDLRLHLFDDGPVLARVDVHENGTAENPEPHPHRGVTLFDASDIDPDTIDAPDYWPTR